MPNFQQVFFDANSIHLKLKCEFHRNGLKMLNEQPPLTGLFAQVLQKVAAASAGESARILAEFSASLVEGESFDLSQIEKLPDEDDQLLCLALFEFCMTEGLTEDERAAISHAFAPFIETYAPGVRH